MVEPDIPTPFYRPRWQVLCPLCGHQFMTERLEFDHCGSDECRLEWKRLLLGRERSRRYRERHRGS